ncbi:MAG: DUF2934 domain-containing protein [Candidatus Binataceae bacterium]|jgi:hypothetical protein
MSDRIREHAYHIWEKEGRPEGRDIDHWTQAEREIGKNGNSSENHASETASDPHGIHAAEEYNRGVQKSVQSGKSGSAANEAKEAIDGPEGESLKQAEKAGKRASKGNEAAGQR